MRACNLVCDSCVRWIHAKCSCQCDEMKSEGAAQELKGDAQKTTGDAKNAAKDAIDKTAAALKKPL